MAVTLQDYAARQGGSGIFGLIGKLKLVVLSALLAGFAFAATPSTARAEVGDTVSFTPSQWGGASLTGNGQGRAQRGSSRRASAAASYDDGSRPQRRSTRPIAAPRESVSGGGIAWRASSGCLASNLRAVIASVASSYGSVTVNSTCRSHSHNRRVGGASKSWHLTGEAADIRVHGNWRSAAAYLRSSVGGFKHYGGGLFHIDNGPSRSW